MLNLQICSNILQYEIAFLKLGFSMECIEPEGVEALKGLLYFFLAVQIFFFPRMELYEIAVW